jgi:hypothetical protein
MLGLWHSSLRPLLTISISKSQAALKLPTQLSSAQHAGFTQVLRRSFNVAYPVLKQALNNKTYYDMNIG